MSQKLYTFRPPGSIETGPSISLRFRPEEAPESIEVDGVRWPRAQKRPRDTAQAVKQTSTVFVSDSR